MFKPAKMNVSRSGFSSTLSMSLAGFLLCLLGVGQSKGGQAPNMPKKIWSQSARIALQGTAKDSKVNAVLLLGTAKMPVYIQGLENWADKDIGRHIVVEGILIRRHFLPVATQDENGAWSQGVMAGSGPDWVLERPKIVTQPLAPMALPFSLAKTAWPARAACIESITEALLARGEKSADFYLGSEVKTEGANLVFALWHRDAFLAKNRNVTGNPGGKSRTAVCVKKTSKLDRFLFWQ